jgi:hypothetical protein
MHMDAHVHLSTEALSHAATILLLVFATLAPIDGVYIHLIRLKLYARPESWPEHVWHTVRTLLFLPATYALFGVVSGGALLWAGIAIAVVDQAVEVVDMASEKDSRAGIGGLSSFEYILHGILTLLRSAAIALSLAARPAAAFSLNSPNIVAQLDEPYGWLVRQLYPGAIVLALVHIWLAIRHRTQPVRRAT